MIHGIPGVVSYFPLTAQMMNLTGGANVPFVAALDCNFKAAWLPCPVPASDMLLHT